MSDRAFFQRIYRMDDKACENWTPLVGKVGEVAEEEIDLVESKNDAAQREYFMAAFQPLAYYSARRSQERQSEDGALVRRPENFLPSLEG